MKSILVFQLYVFFLSSYVVLEHKHKLGVKVDQAPNILNQINTHVYGRRFALFVDIEVSFS